MVGGIDGGVVLHNPKAHPSSWAEVVVFLCANAPRLCLDGFVLVDALS